MWSEPSVSGHAVDCVVDEENRDVLTAIGRVHDLRHADSRKIPVTLVGDHHSILSGTLHSCGDGRSTSMRALDVPGIVVVVGEYRTPDGREEDRPVLDPEAVDRLRDQLLDRPVATTRAIVGTRLARSLPIERFVQ